jgi:hypothetical protein
MVKRVILTDPIGSKGSIDEYHGEDYQGVQYPLLIDLANTFPNLEELDASSSAPGIWKYCGYVNDNGWLPCWTSYVSLRIRTLGDGRTEAFKSLKKLSVTFETD